MTRSNIDPASTTNPMRPGDAQGREGQPTACSQATHLETVRAPVKKDSQPADCSWEDVRSADEFTDLLSQIAHPIVVAFEDQDCDHCRAQRAMLSMVWHQLSWSVTTLRVDCRRLPQLADRYRVLGYPTLLVFSAGQVVDRLPGRRDARSITDRLSRLTRPVCVGDNNGALTGRGTETSTDVAHVAR